MFNFFKNKNKSQYLVTEKEVECVAKRSFNSIMSFLQDIRKLSNIDKSDSKFSIKQILNKMANDFGVEISFNKYSKTLLDNDNFKIFCVYKACLELMVSKKISIPEYIIYKNVLENIISENVINSSIDSVILNNFKVDPSILPVAYKQKIMAIDEFTLATELISTNLKNICNPNGYNTYQEYYDYMVEEVKSIIIKLHNKGFYNTHEIERFALLCTAHKIGIPSMDTFYKNSAFPKQQTPNIPNDNLRHIQEQLFENNFNNNI